LRAHIILDLGFGDAGKGLLTDYFARETGSKLVVRYNGGAQAAHNVVAPDGRHHTFAQFGSASFIPGVRTFLSRYMVIHPTALLVEADVLQQKGVPNSLDRVRISAYALVITPFHQVANRIRELLRGDGRHGSCGVGVGETVSDVVLYGETPIIAGDLSNKALLKQKLAAIREFKYTEMKTLIGDRQVNDQLAEELKVFEADEVIENWICAIEPLSSVGLVVPDEWLADWMAKEKSVIFEGAQGVLLDAEHGFHPYTTWSNVTAENALEILHEMAPQAEINKVGVLRSYMVRHGPGPLPTETDNFADEIHEHNTLDDWQGKVRYGWLDAVLARYALKLVEGVDKLAITHMDVVPTLSKWQICTGYRNWEGMDETLMDLDVQDGAVRSFVPRFHLSLDQRTALTGALLQVRPAMQLIPAEEAPVLAQISKQLGQTVDIISRGATAEHVRRL
jgi:adenylosuccinate synthase